MKISVIIYPKRNQFWQSLEEAAGKRCSDCSSGYLHVPEDVNCDLPRTVVQVGLLTAENQHSFGRHVRCAEIRTFIGVANHCRVWKRGSVYVLALEDVNCDLPRTVVQVGLLRAESQHNFGGQLRGDKKCPCSGVTNRRPSEIQGTALGKCLQAWPVYISPCLRV